MEAETKNTNLDSFFARILARVDYSQTSPETLRQKHAASLIDTLNRMIEAGAAFDVAEDNFELCGASLSRADEDFLSLNKSTVLCTLQQSLLVKNLFSYSQSSFSDFAFEIAERESRLTEHGKVSIEAHFEAVREVTQKWFRNLLILGN